MLSSLHTIALVAFVLSSATAARAAEAEATAPEDQQTALDEIIVTGEKASRTLQNTPSSVRVVTAEEIDIENLISVYDVIDRTANLTSTLGESGFTIRGIANTNVTGQGTGDLATVYLDGSPLPRSAMSGPLDLWDLAQVEVLRGPQSTLQGRNALAGAIILKTNDPTYDWTGNARVIVTNKIDERRYAGAIGGPIVPGQIAFRLAAEHSEQDGVIRNLTTGDDDYGFKKGDNIRGKLLFTPEALPGLRVVASWMHDKHRNGATYAFSDVSDAWSHRTLEGNRDTIDHAKSDIATIDASYDITEALALSSVTTWSRIRTTTEYDGDNLAEDNAYGGLGQDQKTVTQEVRLNLTTDRLTALLGGYYSRLDNKKDRSSSVFSLGLDDLGLPVDLNAFYPGRLYIDTFQAYPQVVRNLAVFGDATWEVVPRLKLRAGFRWDEEKQTRANNNNVTLLTPLPDPALYGPFGPTIAYVNAQILGLVSAANASSPPVKTNFHAFLPKGGVTYELNDDVSLSATVQRGYRSGGSGVNPGRGELYTYKPEFTWNYELAFRSLWLNRKLSFNANAFYIDWSDQQVIFYPPPRETYNYYTRNAGTSRVYGFEAEVRYQPDRSLTFYGSVGHSNTKFTDFVIAATDYGGNEFPNAPRWTAALGGTWQAQQGWFVNLNANWRSAAYQDIDDQDRRQLKAHMIANAKVGWRGEAFGAYVAATNIFDKHYFNYKYMNGSREQALYGEPRVLGVMLEARF